LRRVHRRGLGSRPRCRKPGGEASDAEREQQERPPDERAFGLRPARKHLAAVAWSGVIWLKVVPAALYVDESGVTIRNPYREVRLRWNEVAQFRLARMKRGAYAGALFVWVDSLDGTTTPVYGLSERDPIAGSRPHFVERAVSELDRRLQAERVTAG
jgi:hypothetical protein